MPEAGAVFGKRSFAPLIAVLLTMAVLGALLQGGGLSTLKASGNAGYFVQSTPSLTNITLFIPPQETVQTGSVLTFTVNASDSFNPSKTVYLSASGLPLGATFPQAASGNPISATFSWAPTSSQGPGNYTITFQASYYQNSSSIARMMLIQVGKAQKLLPPILTVPGPQTISPGTFLSFAIVAEDPNLPPSPVNVTATGLPQGSSFDVSARIFSWRPTASQAPGVYILMFAASDPNGLVVSRVTITVVGSSAVLSLPQSPIDYFAYSSWVLIPALGIALFYIYQLKRQGKNSHGGQFRRPTWLGGSQAKKQTLAFPGLLSKPEPGKE